MLSSTFVILICVLIVAGIKVVIVTFTDDNGITRCCHSFFALAAAVAAVAAVAVVAAAVSGVGVPVPVPGAMTFWAPAR